MAESTLHPVMTIRGICPHGKVRFMAVDVPLVIDARVRRGIGEMVAAGFTMDRVTVEEARKSDMNCPTCEATKKKLAKSKQRCLGKGPRIAKAEATEV